MLIEFRCTNFRSIREEQVLSLVAKNTDRTLSSCIIEKKLPGLSGLSYLRGAAIYGANASGKSNVIEAISFMAEFITSSITDLHPGDMTGVEPFKLDSESLTMPSRFEITFVANDVRYLFGFSANRIRVLEEYLVAYPNGAPQKWYHRTYNDILNKYEWTKSSAFFKQDRSLQDKTRDNTLFLSVGTQFNHPQLTPVFKWFSWDLRFLNLNAEHDIPYSLTAFRINDEKYKARLLNLIRSADFGVSSARIKKKEVTEDEIKNNHPRSTIESRQMIDFLKSDLQFDVTLSHKGEGIEPVEFDFDDEESAGTRRFFALIGFWVDTIEKGYTVFIDEIETSLHPILIKELLKLLLCSENNPKGAQVIFTTHNPVLLDGNLFRRDQIWFTEKAPSGATCLYPLTDYQPRSSEALAKGYIAGRYGAIPFIPGGLKLE